MNQIDVLMAAGITRDRAIELLQHWAQQNNKGIK